MEFIGARTTSSRGFMTPSLLFHLRYPNPLLGSYKSSCIAWSIASLSSSTFCARVFSSNISFCQSIVRMGWLMESGSLYFISCHVWAVANSFGRMVPGGCVVRNRIQVVDCCRTDKASSCLMRSLAMVWHIICRSSPEVGPEFDGTYIAGLLYFDFFLEALKAVGSSGSMICNN